MSGFTVSSRRSARISASKLGQRPKQEENTAAIEYAEPVSPAVDASKPVEPAYNGSESLAFRKMASKNPALLALASTLDLFEVSSTILKPGPLPALIERVATESLNPKLKVIAQKAFARSTTYTQEDAVNRLASVTNVSPDRARNGIALMYAQCILSLTLSHEYYLTDSTPF